MNKTNNKSLRLVVETCISLTASGNRHTERDITPELGTGIAGMPDRLIVVDATGARYSLELGDEGELILVAQGLVYGFRGWGNYLHVLTAMVNPVAAVLHSERMRRVQLAKKESKKTKAKDKTR